MGKPLVIDLFCGLGGWTKGFLAEGYDAIGFDIERHVYGEKRYPAQLVLQDVLTLHGRQFKDIAAIMASPPCQEFSYMAMPWSRAKQIAGALRGQVPFPVGYQGSLNVTELTALFDACFRLQREASEAAGRHIPMVVENVKGAQPWVGMARAHFGSFYLWGDVGSVAGSVVAGGVPKFGQTIRARSRAKCPGQDWNRFLQSGEVSPDWKMQGNGQKFNPDGTAHPQGSWFAIADSKERGANGQKGRTNFHFFEQTGLPSPSFHGAEHESSVQRAMAVKAVTSGDGKRYGGDFGWDGSAMRTGNSKSESRKEASAQIAEIPIDLARYIARSIRHS